jgi:hypothetical protein
VSACTGPIVEVRRPSELRSREPLRPVEPSPEPTRTEVASEAAVARYEPFKGETYPNAKRLAGRFIETLMTYDAGEKPRRVLGRATRRADRAFPTDAVARVIRPLFVPGAESRGEVVYPQLGGLAFGSGGDRACVMVVANQHLRLDSGDTRTISRTVDVRLVSRDDEWLLEDLVDVGPEPVRRPAANLPEVARQVLNDTRIELPDTARWDILAGDIDERLLKTMLDLAAVAAYSVAVLKTGHPKNVFATDRISGHTLGRGVDIWRIAGEPVVLQQPDEDSQAHGFTAAALEDLDVPELGSPWDLDGPPEPGKVKPSFTDAVHADHIHVAFKAA